MARTPRQAKVNADARPDGKLPPMYRARAYHEIKDGDGIKRVEPGFIVVTTGGHATIYPPGKFAVLFPDDDVSSIPEKG